MVGMRSQARFYLTQADEHNAIKHGRLRQVENLDTTPRRPMPVLAIA